MQDDAHGSRPERERVSGRLSSSWYASVDKYGVASFLMRDRVTLPFTYRPMLACAACTFCMLHRTMQSVEWSNPSSSCGHSRRAGAVFEVTQPSATVVIVPHPSLTFKDRTRSISSRYCLPLSDTVIQLGEEMSDAPWILNFAYKVFITRAFRGEPMQSAG